MMIILLTVIFYPLAYHAVANLTSRMQNAIFVAYMNGFVAALKLDIGKIEAMKADRKLMKTVVMDTAREYVHKVEGMN